MAGLLVDTGCWILDDKDLFPLKKGGLRGLFLYVTLSSMIQLRSSLQDFNLSDFF